METVLPLISGLIPSSSAAAADASDPAGGAAFSQQRVCKVAGGPVDCFAISSLHLLCQTRLPELMGEPPGDDHAECRRPACILAEFFAMYKSARVVVIPFPNMSR